jgi:hypothetical protein
VSNSLWKLPPMCPHLNYPNTLGSYARSVVPLWLSGSRVMRSRRISTSSRHM